MAETNDPLRLLSIGAGAIGTYIGGSLALGGHEVVFVERPEFDVALFALKSFDTPGFLASLTVTPEAMPAIQRQSHCASDWSHRWTRRH